MALIKCPECGKEISDKASSCPNCGTPLNDQKFCKFCGEKIDKDCVICPKCGKQVEDIKRSDDRIVINNNNTNTNANTVTSGYDSMISPKSWIVTLLLCIFLGVIGIHRFYVGKVGTGILMILLCLTGISAVWALVDLIFILLKRFKDKQGRLIKN